MLDESMFEFFLYNKIYFLFTSLNFTNISVAGLECLTLKLFIFNSAVLNIYDKIVNN